jgi:hypothetical protein
MGKQEGIMSRLESSSTAPSSGQGDATPVLPPLRPAVLVSQDGQTRFSILLLRWETALLPCTRYDEWLECHLGVSTLHDSRVLEGPFLLRFEVEEIFNAAQQAALGNFTAFQSDFLEPVLRFQLYKKPETGDMQVQVVLTPPSLPHVAGNSVTESPTIPVPAETDAPEMTPLATVPPEGLSVQMTVSTATLQAFCAPLAEQLESFLSLM